MTADAAGRTAPDVGADTLLRLMWLASPALPVGGFSYSEGLGSAVESGRVVDESGARDWLVDQLHLVLARSDLPVVASTHAAWARADRDAVRTLNAWVLSTRETAELRRQSEQMGRSLAAWMNGQSPAACGPDDALVVLEALATAPTWPVAFALAAIRAQAPLRETLLAFAFGWAENMVQAAIKAVPLGQTAGQRVLSSLVEEIPLAVENASALAAGDRQAFAPMLALLSSRHETQYSRLFRS